MIMHTRTSASNGIHSPWRTDLTTVSPNARRAARYALQLLAGLPSVQDKLGDDEFLSPLWAIIRPLLDPRRLLELRAQWQQLASGTESTDRDGGEAFAGGHRRYRRTEHGLLEGLPGARMRDYLVRCFTLIPDALIERLSLADGCEPTNPAVAVLARCTGLDDTETAVLDLVEKKDSAPAFREFLRELPADSFREHYAWLAAALGVPTRELQRRLHRSAPLSTLRLVGKARRQCDAEDFLIAESLLEDIVALEPHTPDELLSSIVEPAADPACTLADFPHLRRDAERLQSAFRAAASQRTSGVNALFYGIPGTGKTQFALALAKAAGLAAYMVRTSGDDDEGLSRSGRLAAYQLTQRLLRGRDDCVIIFDEVEDAFANADSSLIVRLGGEARAGSDKGWMNRTLEENRIPAIWITNDAASMDRAFLRRYLLPVAFGTPPRRVRRQIAERHLGDTLVSADVLDELAADSALLPAQFDAARRLLRLRYTDDPESVVRQGISASRRLLYGSASPRARQSATAFDVAYLNLAGGIAPARIGDALTRTGRGSLCFFGPPGTGKTELAHVLADTLDRELIVRASSDLVSPYVGQTERNLAELFAETDAEHSVLFLDEVDSLLRDRRQAKHSWEATPVNELLQQMERFPGIFIAATNLIGQLDQAAMRRFDFKLQFQPLTPAQRLSLFAREAMGDASQASSLPTPIANKLQALEGLTPGDFANVARQRELLGEELPTEEFLRRLVVECRYKVSIGAAA